MTMGKNKICFFMPSYSVGGCQFLFARVAKYLSQNCNFEIFYIDYKDGFVKNLLNNSIVKFVQYKEQMKSINIDDNCTIVTPVSLAFKLPKFKGKNIKILFWNLHPENINWMRQGANLNFFQVTRFLKVLNEKNGLINQDIATFATAKKYYKNSKENYTSLFMEKVKYKIRENLIKDRELNIAWLGRLDNDKIWSLINLMDNLKNIKTDKIINLHIIGEGNAKNKIKAEDYSSNFNIKFLGTIVNEKLQNYLSNNIDILFGMGMSLIEAQRLAIPAVLTFLSCDKFTNNKFAFSNNLKNYLVGCDLNFKKFDIEAESLEIILDKFMNNIEFYSRSSINHFEEEFNITKQMNLFKTNFNKCNFTQESLLYFKKLFYKENKKNIFDFIDKKINPTVKFFKRLSRDKNYKFLIFASSYSYFGNLKQRPEHLFECFIKDGYKILWAENAIKRVVEVSNDIYLYPMQDTSALILNKFVKNKIVMSISTHLTCNGIEKSLLQASRMGIPVVFEHLDDIALLNNKKMQKILTKRLKSIANENKIIISATSDKLYEQAVCMRKGNDNIIIAKNAVDFEYFQNLEQNNKNLNPKFEEFICNGRPIIGYYGVISGNWFDFDLLEYSIIQNPKLQFVLIGIHNQSEINRFMKYNNFLCLDKMPWMN
jgi:hypothetical protein